MCKISPYARISLNVSRGARKSCVQFNWRKYAPRKNSAEQGLRGGFKKKKETASFPTYRPIKDVVSRSKGGEPAVFRIVSR